MAAPEQMSGAKRRLLEKFLRGEVARQNWEIPLEPRTAGSPAPLAPDQHLIWLSAEMAGSEPAYNEPITLHYRGALDREVLERSFHEVIRRHEILRTTFASVNGEVVQAVHDHLTIPIPFLDLSKLGKDEGERRANEIALADCLRPFDLGVGPLFRARLVKLEPEYHRLYITLHHLIFDGASIYQVLLPEVAAIYKAFAAGEPSPFPAPVYQYADFALWQKRLLDNDSVAKQKAYWREQLKGDLPELQLPLDRPRPAAHSYRGGMKTFALSQEMTARLKATCRDEGVTLYMFLLASFKTLLHRYSGQEDILVGGPSDVRRRPEFQKMMGHCVNFLALRTHPAGEQSFREYLAQVKDTVLAALANSDVPFDHLIRDLWPRRESTRRPFFQVILAVEPQPIETADPGWDLTHTDTATGFAKIDLYLEIDERPDGLRARFVYSTDLFDASTIDRMADHWLTLLQSAMDAPGARLCDLAMLQAEEERQLRTGWNQTRREIPRTTVHELVEQQAARTPNSIAVEAAAVRLTYRQLNDRANRLADRLRNAGVKTGTLVALCVERTIDLVVAPLAVLKAGGAYVPLDPAFPKDRLAYLVEDARAPVLLTQRSLEGRVPRAAGTIYCDEAGDRETGGFLRALSRVKPLERAAATNIGHPDDLAYVRYTSGSTGRPKGVEISHRAMVNLLLAMQREPGFTAADSLLAVTTFSFDISELEIYLPLISGGRLVIASREDARDPLRLIDRLREAKCTVLQATPVSWQGLIEAGWKGQRNLRAFCGGEALSRDLAEQLLPRVAELWNLYGPTETTVWSAAHKVSSGAGPVAIGHPIDNTDIYVLDAHRNLAPVGVAGELYIGGAGVARGYLRREDLTVERFVPHPFHAGERLYRTGDLARRTVNGTLECLGRIDNQIKIRGFRIEPGEIEAALLEHPGVRAAAVRVWPDASGNQSIAAYIAGAAVEREELRRFLQQKLPDYMIPSRFVALESLPLTPNGKVDRGALPEPPALERIVRSIAPRTEAERKLRVIWESVLDARPIGIEDSFFDLGGHSFLVAKLLRRIESEFGQRLSMAALFEAPTISRLAALLGDASSIRRLPRTINLQPVGAREPLFWIHAGPPFRPLAMHLGTNRPFLGVDFERGEDEDFVGFTFPELAERLVRTIRAVQPHGPYHLGGWCISGLLAYEAAAQLIDAGEVVKLVAVIDSANPTYFRTIPKYTLMASKAVCHLKRILHTEIGEALVYGKQRMKGLFSQLADRQPVEADPLETVLNNAAIAYDPKPIQARVLVVQPVDHPEALDLRTSWAELRKFGNLEVSDIPGTHASMFEQPHVAALAWCIAKRLADNVVEMKRAIAG
jgi:amino acid adenylation domain-containing protein